jgi:hypothetical protein
MTAGRAILVGSREALAAWKLRRALIRAVALGATGEVTWSGGDDWQWVHRMRGHCETQPTGYVIRLPDIDRGIIFGPASYDSLEVD